MSTVATLVKNLIVKITNPFLQGVIDYITVLNYLHKACNRYRDTTVVDLQTALLKQDKD